MAWTFVGVSAAATVTGTPLTLAEPAGVAQGDLLIACIASRTTSLTSIVNTGWTLVNEQKTSDISTNTSAIASGVMLYQVRGASAPDLTFTLPASGTSVCLGRMVAYRGNVQTTPVDVSTAVTTATNTLAVSVTGLTTTLADDLLVAMCAGGQEAAWSAFAATNPATASGATDITTQPTAGIWYERADSNTTTGSDTSLAIFDAVKATAGATGNLTATASLGAGHVVIACAFKMLLPATADAWNTNDKSASVTLSNNDKTAAYGSSNQGVRSTQARLHETAGKYYAEFLCTDINSLTRIGIATTTAALTSGNDGCLVSSTGEVYRDSNTVGTNIGTFVDGNVVCLAYDAGAQRIWFRVNNGYWNNVSSADPSNPSDLNYVNLTSFLAVNYALFGFAATTPNTITVRTETAEFTQSPMPSGFTSWMGEALSSVTHYTMPAATGAFALGGVTAQLRSTRVLPAPVAGSFALTGTAAGLTAGAPPPLTHYAMLATTSAFRVARQSVKPEPERWGLGKWGGAHWDGQISLPAVKGVFTVAQQPAALRCGRASKTNVTPFLLAGQTAVTRITRKLPATVAGAFTLAGQAATPRVARKLPAVNGTFALAGIDATLTKTTAVIHRTMPAAAGAFTLAGQVTALRASRTLPALKGTFTLAGQAAALRYGHAAVAVKGTFTLSGQIAGLRYGHRTVALAGAFTLNGQLATLRYVRRVQLAAVSGAFTLAGQTSNLIYVRKIKMASDSSAFTLNGQPSNLVYSGSGDKGMPAASAAFTLSGQTAGLRATHRPLTAVSGAFTLSGQTAGLLAVRKLTAVQGAFTLTGQPATLTKSTAVIHRTLTADAGAFSLSGKAAVFRAARRLTAAQGTTLLAGQSATLTKASHRTMPAAAGAVALSGKAAGLRAAFRLTAAQGAILLTGKPAGLDYGARQNYTMATTPGLVRLEGVSAALSKTHAPPPIRQEALRFGRSVYVSRW